MKVNMICYKTKNPVIYNKGTQNEKSEDTFLYVYGSPVDAEAEKRVANLNALLPSDKMYNGINLGEVKEFFIGGKHEVF